jgi:hypothetical protein
MEISMEFPQKRAEIELSYDPAIPLLGIYLKESKSACIPLIMAALFTISKVCNQVSADQ